MKLTKRIGVGLSRRVIVTLLAIGVLANAAAATNAQTTDSRIAAINRHVAEVDQQIAESESSGEFSSIFRNELVLNQLGNPWPAVGIYHKLVRFYYTYGDREVDPYPSRLLKITVTTKRSDRHEYAEFVFEPSGNLHFAKVANGAGDDGDDAAATADRYYFGGGKVISVHSGSKDPTQCGFTTIDSSRAVMDESKKLVAIFRNSLE
jgi:hypothetical protein